MFQLDQKKYNVLFYLIVVIAVVLGISWTFNLVPADKEVYVLDALLFIGGKLAGMLFTGKGE